MNDRAGGSGAPVDWRALRERLASAWQGLEQATETTGAAASSVLQERARALARPAQSGDALAGSLEVIRFRLGPERYGIESHWVREVVRLRGLTRVPGAPERLLGVTNHRGSVLAIFDLRRVLGVERPGISHQSRLIVLGTERNELALVADEVYELELVPPHALTQPDGLASGPARRIVRGVSADALIVLDGQALLVDEALFIDARPGGPA